MEKLSQIIADKSQSQSPISEILSLLGTTHDALRLQNQQAQLSNDQTLDRIEAQQQIGRMLLSLIVSKEIRVVQCASEAQAWRIRQQIPILLKESSATELDQNGIYRAINHLQELGKADPMCQKFKNLEKLFQDLSVQLLLNQASLSLPNTISPKVSELKLSPKTSQQAEQPNPNPQAPNTNTTTNPTSKDIRTLVNEYLDKQVQHVKTQLTEYCHQLRFPDPVYSKTQKGKKHSVKCRIEVPLERAAEYAKTVYQKQVVALSGKQATIEAARLVLEQFYVLNENKWKEFKDIKVIKKLNT